MGEMSEGRSMTGDAAVPLPGSNEASEQGCRCPVLDNYHGKGIGGLGKRYWTVGDCPLHELGWEPPEADIEEQKER